MQQLSLHKIIQKANEHHLKNQILLE